MTLQITPRDPSDVGLSAVSAEVVIMTVVDADLKVMLLKRTEHPFKGTWALPGGLVHIRPGKNQGEDLTTTAQRILAEHTNIAPKACSLQQLHTFGRAGRDPRMRVISVAWCALVPPRIAAIEGKSEATWFSTTEEVPWIRLAFDHAEILQMGIERVQSNIDHSKMAFELVPPTFTVGELRDVYEAIKNKRYDPRNFRRRFQRMVEDGMVEEAPGKRHLGKSRPAKVWRLRGRKS